MKKTNKQSQLKNTTGTENPLIEAAKMLITEIKSPAALLDFMLEASWWREELCNKRGGKVDNYDTRMFIKYIIKPWFVGGDRVVEKIAEGIKELKLSYACENYAEYMSHIIQAYGVEIKEGFYSGIDEYAYIIGPLIKVGFYLDQYENIKKVDEEKHKKLSKVA